MDGQDIEAFAARLGVGSRHLRRLFTRYVGASPMQVARTRRVLIAKRLITDSDLPMTEVALKAGFNSVRQFNHTFQKLYSRSPSVLRRTARSNKAGIMQ